ncbi:MAG: zinc-ribbon domain-containing protein [Thermoguttaceae bacterium]|jgi:hypothetical protein
MQESDDDFNEDESPDEDVDDDPTETVPCPSCGADVYEDAEQCPYCGTYITSQTSPWAGRSVWWIVLAVLGLLATILVLSGLVP